jgi:hypothetical protein
MNPGSLLSGLEYENLLGTMKFMFVSQQESFRTRVDGIKTNV